MKIIFSTQSLLAVFIALTPLISCASSHSTLTLTTNSISRWFSKNNNNPGVQANIDYQHALGLYLGSSVANIHYTPKDNEDYATVEITPYLGWSFKLSDQWRLDTQWSRYLFDGTIFGHSADYNEFYLFLHYSDLFTGRISVSDDYYALGNYAIDYELKGKYPITDRIEISASFGYSQTSAVLGSDYPYWNSGITYYYKFIALDLRYMDATETAINQAMVEKLHQRYDPPTIKATCVFSISVGF